MTLQNNREKISLPYVNIKIMVYQPVTINKLSTNSPVPTLGILCQGSKLHVILFPSRFLATIWSTKVAKCKMWVAKIGKKEKSFFPWWHIVLNYMKIKLTKTQDGCSMFAVERLRSSPRLHTNRKKWTVGITTEIDAKYFNSECIIKLFSFVWI